MRLVPAVNAEQARLAFATPWKWAYCVVVAVLCLIAVPVALAPVTASWGQHLSRRLIYTLACVDRRCLSFEPGRAWCSVLSGDDRPVHGHGDLGAMVLPGRHSVHPEHVALETRSVVPWIPAWTR